MMEDIRRHLLSLIVTAMLCGLLPQLLGEGGVKTLVRTLCGMVLAVTFLSSLGNVQLSLPDSLPGFQQEGALAAAEGEALAEDALREGIKSRAEAYIQDKGALLGADIQVQLELDPQPPYGPTAARIDGVVSDEARQALSQLLADAFSIPKEAQTWMP